MRTVDVEIEAPCDEDWDAMRVEAGGVRRFCERCQHAVHDLSGMDEARARAFLRATEGQPMCIAYVEDEAGEIVFEDAKPPARPSATPSALIPLAQVRRRSRAPAGGLASAASLAVVLTGCTPHGEPQRTLQVDEPESASVVVAPTTVIPDTPTVDAPPASDTDELDPGELEPCEPEPRRPQKKGRRKRTAGVRLIPDHDFSPL
jgi:hypothetical protein